MEKTERNQEIYQLWLNRYKQGERPETIRGIAARYQISPARVHEIIGYMDEKAHPKPPPPPEPESPTIILECSDCGEKNTLSREDGPPYYCWECGTVL